MIRIMTAPSAIAALLALTLAAVAGSAEAADDALGRLVGGRTFDGFVADTLQRYAVPGAVVAVVRPDGPVLLKGYGVRRRDAADPVGPETRFQIASLSKFVTATAVGSLVDRRVVAWDVPVRSFAPDTVLAVPYASETATLRDYFAHRTGLPAYTGDLLAQLGYGPDELVRRARHLPLVHGFRAQWGYSNYGIFLGQAAASRAAGVGPPDLLAGLFMTLEMARSGPTRAELFKDEDRSAGHDLDGTVMPAEDVDAFSGAGAVVSTGGDVARWMEMLLAKGVFRGRAVLHETTIAEIFAASMVQGPGGPLADPNDAAGLGCESYQFRGERVIEKNGALNGVRSIVTLIPGRGIGIAVLANKQLTLFPEAVRAEFLERELGPSGRDLQAQIRTEQAAWNALLDLPKPPADAAPLRRDARVFAGEYESALYGHMTVAWTGQAFDVRVGPNRYPGHLVHWSGDTFLLRFDSPDDAPGLVTFDFNGPTVRGFQGSRIPATLTVDYGHFARLP